MNKAVVQEFYLVFELLGARSGWLLAGFEPGPVPAGGCPPTLNVRKSRRKEGSDERLR